MFRWGLLSFPASFRAPRWFDDIETLVCFPLAEIAHAYDWGQLFSAGAKGGADDDAWKMPL